MKRILAIGITTLLICVICMLILYDYTYFYVERHDINETVSAAEKRKRDYDFREERKKELPRLEAQLDILQKEKDSLGDKFFECEQDSDCTSFEGSACSCPKEVFVKRVYEYNFLKQLISNVKKGEMYSDEFVCAMFCPKIPSKCESGKCIAI